ncbi:MAG: hypothetical protein U5K75_00305 [Ahrensia sp.]|nr:hypothetical protein [Ahrensia sp.]
MGNATPPPLLLKANCNATVEKLGATGKPLTIMASHVGDDFNDLMQGIDE